MLAFLAKSGLDLKLGSKHVCGCSTSFWMTMSHEAHGYRLKDYIDIVEEENEGKLLSAHNLDEYQTAWKAYLGDEFQVRLRGMQPTFSASLGRETRTSTPSSSVPGGSVRIENASKCMQPSSSASMGIPSVPTCTLIAVGSVLPHRLQHRAGRPTNSSCVPTTDLAFSVRSR